MKTLAALLLLCAVAAAHEETHAFYIRPSAEMSHFQTKLVLFSIDVTDPSKPPAGRTPPRDLGAAAESTTRISHALDARTAPLPSFDRPWISRRPRARAQAVQLRLLEMRNRETRQRSALERAGARVTWRSVSVAAAMLGVSLAQNSPLVHVRQQARAAKAAKQRDGYTHQNALGLRHLSVTATAAFAGGCLAQLNRYNADMQGTNREQCMLFIVERASARPRGDATVECVALTPLPLSPPPPPPPLPPPPNIESRRPADNVALRKPTSASSAYLADGLDSNPYRAVDGVTGGNHSADREWTSDAWDKKPWWQVNLQDRFKLDHIKIFNRTDCCAERLRDITVRVLRHGREVFQQHYPGKVPVDVEPNGQESFTVDTKGVEGDSVKIEKNGEGLQLPEVQVWGDRPVSHAELCANGDIKPKAYAIRLMANRKMCWKWSDASTKITVTDDCKDLHDMHTHFVFDTAMRIHSAVNAKQYGNCVDLSSSTFKTGDTLRGSACGEQPTQRFLLNLNLFKKAFHGCPSTTKPMRFYPTAYGKIMALGSLSKCVGVEGSSGEFEGTHDLALDECSADLKDQDWELVPVPARPRILESYRAEVDPSGFESEDADAADVPGWPLDEPLAGDAVLAHTYPSHSADELGGLASPL
eukprot:tig00000194_g14826.t1